MNYRLLLRRISFAILIAIGLQNDVAAQNLFVASAGQEITVVVPEHPEPLEKFAISELARHIEQITGHAPTISPGGSTSEGNVVVIGQVANNSALSLLADEGFLQVNHEQQGYSMRIDHNPRNSGDKTWIAILCGADPHGTLYAVRDFSHYYFFKDGADPVLRPARTELAPRLKLRGLSESGCNLFSAKNDHEKFMHTVTLNYFSEEVVFDKHYYIDWLSEWKINFISLLWTNYPAYDEARQELAKYAHARGIKLLGFFVPYRPSHEMPPATVSKVDAMLEHGDCPRDLQVRKWYFDRLIELVTREPKIDMVQIESPYHDGVYCQCSICQGTKNPYPEDKLLAEMVEVVRKHRPDIPIVRGFKQPVPNMGAAKRLAAELRELEGPNDWYLNSYLDREHRRHWHNLGPKYATYLRLYRSALKGNDVVRDVNFLFSDFQMSASRDIIAHQFCYRFYAGNYGSFPVEQDRQMLHDYPDRKGPFSLALTAEAAFDPFIQGRDRAEKIRRIHALTIPDYPLDRSLGDEDFKGVARSTSSIEEALSPNRVDPAAYPQQSKLFRYQWGISDPGFLLAQICADLDNDGRREIFYSSRGTKKTSLLDAASGKPRWTVSIPGDHQSACAYDLDGDETYEILFTTSNPGRLYVVDCKTGAILKQWEADDWKLGNSPVIFDGDGDGVLDGYLGSRSKNLLRLDMQNFKLVQGRDNWIQCGCHTSAMDVNGDGHWDLFAGSGDDGQSKGVLHRFDPVTLQTIWSYPTDDNASSADAVLADIDGDGAVEVIKSVDNYAGDDSHDAIYAFETDGTLLWKVEGFAGEDSPNVADLDHDGQVEIVGMTFGGEVYCLDAGGQVRWRKDLRPELDDSAHAYMTPILCDLNGDENLEILVMTNGPYFDDPTQPGPSGILFALSSDGEIIDRFDMRSPRFWGFAFVANTDDDPNLELVVAGSGGVDVIETQGYGANTEHFQRRRNYQRLNVVRRAYEDSYFIYRGTKTGVENLTDNLVLRKKDGRYGASGSFTTELLTLPPGCFFDQLTYEARIPLGTALEVNILNSSGDTLQSNVASGSDLIHSEPVRIEFVFSATDRTMTPILDAYALSFQRHLKGKHD